MGRVLITILIAARAAKCKLVCLAVYSRLRTLFRRFNVGSFIRESNLRQLATRAKSSAVIHCLKPLKLSIRSKLRDLAARLRLESLVGRIRSLSVGTVDSYLEAQTPAQPDPDALNSRVRFEAGQNGDATSDVFVVEICGSIHASSAKEETTLKVTIHDVTGAALNSEPVLAKAQQWQTKDSDAFCHSAELGRLTGRDTILSDWTSVAQLQADWLLFARKGRRDLLFRASVLSRCDSRELACAECFLTYDNKEFGYIDVEENRQRTKNLAVALAFTVSASDGKLFNCEVDLIKDWARENVCLSQASCRARRKLEKALKKTVAFFRNGNQLNTHAICKELVEIAPLSDRHRIIELCLQVVQAKGSVAPEELAVLGSLSGWLEVDGDDFRAMMERILPVNIHQVEDAEIILGVTSDMSEEKARRHLNKEYSKWNARVTNSDPQIQAQADQMLGLIAEARREYVG